MSDHDGESRDDAGPPLTFVMTLVMAAACGVTVANIYYNQPMLGIMERDFPRGGSVAGLIPTATQLGYAVGLFLLIPLGDRIERRALILWQTAALTLSLVATALAPDAWSLTVASAVVGITATVAQQIVPLAAALAQPERRGAAVGAVMSGLLCGILGGRALAGMVAEHFGWRAMFWIGAGLSVCIGLLLAATLPRSRATSRESYGQLLWSMVGLVRAEPRLRLATATQALFFGSFIAVWTVLALHLQEAPFHLGADIAGLFGLVGAVGILFAPFAGRLADTRGPEIVIGLCAVVMVASWLVFGLLGSLVGLAAGVILLDFGEQGALVSNQAVVHGLQPEFRNRLNTVFMGGMFVGGAIGSAGAGLSWQLGGWLAVCCFGGALALGGLALQLGSWFARMRRLPVQASLPRLPPIN